MNKHEHDAATSWRRIQNLKFVLLELMTENKKSKKDPIDIMLPYVLQIMQIFDKN